jgi:hypothetical protein
MAPNRDEYDVTRGGLLTPHGPVLGFVSRVAGCLRLTLVSRRYLSPGDTDPSTGPYTQVDGTAPPFSRRRRARRSAANRPGGGDMYWSWPTKRWPGPSCASASSNRRVTTSWWMCLPRY